MNKLSLYVIGIVVIGGLIWYGTSASGNQDNPSEENNTTQEEQSETSLRSILSMSTPQQCTYTDASASGTTFIANNRIRADFTTSGTAAETAHMILKDEKLYIWVDGETQGFVMDAKEADTQSSITEQLDLDAEMDYDCDNWRVDASKFQQPTNVTFTNMSSLMGNTNANSNFDLSQFGF